MKKTFRILSKILLLKVILLALLYAAITIPQDKILISRSIERFTRNTDYTVNIGRFSGNPFSDFHIDKITLADKNGIWLSAENMRLKWHPLALLTTGHVLDRVKADKLEIIRFPETKETTQKKEETSFDLENTLRYIPFDVALNKFLLGGSIAGTPQELQIFAHKKNNRYRALVATLHGPETSLLTDLSLKQNDINGTVLFEEQPDGLLGHLLKLPQQAISADFLLHTDYNKTTRFDRGKIIIGQNILHLSGSLDHDKREIDGVLTVTITDLSAFSTIAQIKLGGSLSGKLTVKGQQNHLETNLIAEIPSASIADIAISNLQLDNTATLDLSYPRKPHFEATGKLDSMISFKENQHTLENTYTLKGDIHQFGGDIAIQATTPYGVSTANITASADLLDNAYSALINAVLSYNKNNYTLHADTAFNPQQITINAIDLNGEGADVKGAVVWQVEQKLADGEIRIDIADLHPLARIFSLPAKGVFKAVAKMDSKANTQLADISISALDLTYAEQRIRLQNAARLNIADQRMELSPAVLQFANGTLTGQGVMDPDHLDALLTAKNIDLSSLFESDILKGRINGTLTLKGKPDMPVIALRSSFQGTSGNKPVNATINGDWQNETARLDAVARAEKTRAALKATLNSRLSLMPFNIDLSEDTAITGNLDLDIGLSMLNPLLWASRQQVDGTISGSMKITGRLNEPQLSGRFNLVNGRYQHATTGICMRNVSATLLGTNDRIAIQNLTSRNSQKGVLSANAGMSLKGSKAINGKIDFSRYRLFCGGLATGIIDGQLNAGGTIKSSTIDGNLVLGPLNVQLPGAQNEAGIPEIETIRISNKKIENTEPPAVTRLNVTLDAPNRIFVRGRGLDAEFGGNLAITGFATDPFINGEFKARRGRFVLLDRTLNLDTAVMRFEGKIPPSPYLNVEAKSNVKGTTVTVNLDGQAIKPKLTLSSQPTLPQDEVLALLLFGRQLQNISPFEAIKLAQAARTLAGLDGGQPGILDKARAKLGLDTLDLGTNEDNDVTVSTGKYVTDSVFVGVQQGTKPEDKQVKTEIELAPSVSANTTIDAEGNQGIGLGWKHDY